MEAQFSTTVLKYTSSVFRKILEDAVREEDDREQIFTSVAKKSKGNLLWIDLACKTLATEVVWNVLNVLDDLPGEFQKFYDNMKQRINSLLWKDGGYCNRVLYIMAAAYGSVAVSDLINLANIPSQVDLSTLVTKYLPFLELSGSMVSFTSASAE
ncbi:het-r [Penicillium vulpinum]|uniref:Uncharacterized protein n=1 Tax=Penicillium vulpinum TaxID=29845 RepID=A0A1V6RWR0_9EURO|nr:het-r [Penicillium vulpinum]KAJ5970263.1 het-r [Penicillium vulpinum]OQE06221.1 hypothetical protein PENVUL_c019G06615 [Penicillium vulpinum]